MMYVISKEINESLPSLEIVCFSHSEKPIGVSEYTKTNTELLTVGNVSIALKKNTLIFRKRHNSNQVKQFLHEARWW